MTDTGTDHALLTGIAAAIASATGTRRAYEWRPDGTPYTDPDAFGIYLDLDPANLLPAITLAAYPLADSFDLSDSEVGVQVRIVSADRAAVKDVSADVFDRLHGLWGGMLGVIRVVSSRRTSGTNLGADANERLVRVDNYTVSIHRPSATRT